MVRGSHNGRLRHPPKLRTVLSALITLVVGLSVAATVFLSYRNYKRSLIDLVASSRIDVLMQISGKVESLQKNTIAISRLYDALAQDVLRGGVGSGGAPDAFVQTERIYQEAMHAIGVDYYITMVGGGDFAYSSLGPGYDFARMEQRLWYLRIPRTLSPGEVYWTQSHHDEDRGDGFYFSLARRVTEGDAWANLLVSIPERALYDTYANVLSGNAVYIVDQKGRIISHSSPAMVDLNYFNMPRLDTLVASGGYRVVEKSGVEYLLSRYDDPGYGLVYIEEIPMRDLLSPLDGMRLPAVVLALAISLCTCLVLVGVVKTVTHPLLRMCEKLQQVSLGHFDTPFDVAGWAEIELINDISGEMTQCISNLFSDLKEKERQKRLAELEFLQAQINPHFMYNTLFSIKCLVDLGENDCASLMLQNFTAMLRTVLESKEEVIPLRQELDTLRQYFVVLQCRYGDELRLRVDIPETLLQRSVLKFILQPIVENSIFHGLEPNGCSGEVTVEAREEEETLILRVSDNGAGMDAQKLDELRARLEGSGGSDGIGILNVQKRIRLHFGGAYGLSIGSVRERGTWVELTMPRFPKEGS